MSTASPDADAFEDFHQVLCKSQLEICWVRPVAASRCNSACHALGLGAAYRPESPQQDIVDVVHAGVQRERQVFAQDQEARRPLSSAGAL